MSCDGPAAERASLESVVGKIVLLFLLPSRSASAERVLPCAELAALRAEGVVAESLLAAFLHAEAVVAEGVFPAVLPAEPGPAVQISSESNSQFPEFDSNSIKFPNARSLPNSQFPSNLLIWKF